MSLPKLQVFCVAVVSLVQAFRSDKITELDLQEASFDQHASQEVLEDELKTNLATMVLFDVDDI